MFSSLIQINDKFNLTYTSSLLNNDIIKIFNGEQMQTTDKTLFKAMGDYQKYVLKNKIIAKSYYDLAKESNTISCVCGEEIKKSGYSKHILTKKHLTIVEKMGTNNIMQEKFILSPLQNAILIGNPGCGKTRTIINYCIDKFKKGMIDNYSNILIISFSKKAQSDFIIRGKNSIKPNLFNSKNVRTFHSLAYSILKNLTNIGSDSSLNTIVLSAKKYLEQLNDAKINNSNDLNDDIVNNKMLDGNDLNNNIVGNKILNNNVGNKILNNNIGNKILNNNVDNNVDNIFDDEMLNDDNFSDDFNNENFDNNNLIDEMLDSYDNVDNCLINEMLDSYDNADNDLINEMLDGYDDIDNDLIDKMLDSYDNDVDNDLLNNNLLNNNILDNNLLNNKPTNTLNSLLSLSEFKSCKIIMVDEAQDINDNQYGLIKFCATHLNIPLILVGDPNQNIYQFQGGTDKYLMVNIDKNDFVAINKEPIVFNNNNQMVIIPDNNNQKAIIPNNNNNNFTPIVPNNNNNNNFTPIVPNNNNNNNNFTPIVPNNNFIPMVFNNNKIPIFNLIDNYRSTSQIIDFINEIRPYKKLFPPMVCGNKKVGDKPIIFNGSYDEILEHIKKEIENHPNKEEIAIIGPVKKAKAIPSKDGPYYYNIGLQLICNYLSKNNIDFTKHYNENSGENSDIKNDFEIKKGFVNILTAHGSKGLEFQKVLVVNYHFKTQSKEPTEEEYENFKFLWYVALSRAISKMIIYVDETKEVFKQIYDVPKNLYTVEGKGFKNVKSNFSQPIIDTEFSVTKIINDNKYFNENVLYDFCQTFKYKLTNRKLFDNVLDLNNIAIHEHSKFSSLYGEFIELLFMFYYYKNKNQIKEFIEKLKNDLINSIICVDVKYSPIINSLSKKGIVDSSGCFYYDEIDRLKLSISEYEFITFCHSIVKNNKIIVYVKIDLFEYDENYIVNLIDSLEHISNENNTITIYENQPISNENQPITNCENQPITSYEKIIFKIKLYFYQIENECKYLLSYNFTKNLESLSIYYEKLDSLAKKCDNFEFQVKVKHTNINLVGFIDILHNNKIIELKFVTMISEKHVIQTLLYYNNKFQDWKIPKDIEIWNFFNGLCYKPIFNEKPIINNVQQTTITNNVQQTTITTNNNNYITNWKLNSFLCKVLKVKMRKNIFMLDLETNEKLINNVLQDRPNPYDNEIIDRFVYEYNLDYVASSGLIKNIFPLTTSHINGIYEKDLNQPTTDKNLFVFKQDMQNILQVCECPIIIAHNGFGFDFIVLEQKGLIDGNFTKLDSKKFLRLLVPNNESQKLVDIYNFVFNVNAIQTHRAESDTMMIVDICKKLGLVADDFIRMINVSYD